MTEQRDYLMERVCPACKGEKHPGIIVCLDCWAKTHDYTKAMLKKTDVYARGRRLFFYGRIERGCDITDSIAFFKEDLERDPPKQRQPKSDSPGQGELGFMDEVPRRKPQLPLDQVLPG